MNPYVHAYVEVTVEHVSRDKNEFRVHNPCIHECKDVSICLHGGCKTCVCGHNFYGHKLVGWWAQVDGCCAQTPSKQWEMARCYMYQVLPN